MLKIITWNCKGLSNSRTIDYIQEIMAILKPDFLCLVETKTNASRVHHFCNRFVKIWDWASIPSTSFSGGIIIMWNRNVGFVTPVAVSRSALHLIISSPEDSWILTTIYNSQVYSDNKKIWYSLSNLYFLNSPWLITWDFNAISSSKEHKGRPFRNYSSKSKLFSSFILENNLFDLEFGGSCFTWCNDQDGLARR